MSCFIFLVNDNGHRLGQRVDFGRSQAVWTALTWCWNRDSMEDFRSNYGRICAQLTLKDRYIRIMHNIDDLMNALHFAITATMDAMMVVIFVTNQTNSCWVCIFVRTKERMHTMYKKQTKDMNAKRWWWSLWPIQRSRDHSGNPHEPPLISGDIGVCAYNEQEPERQTKHVQPARDQGILDRIRSPRASRMQ